MQEDTIWQKRAHGKRHMRKTYEKGDAVMDLDSLSFYFAQYGVAAIFVMVFLEYLNLPGFPAGIIMPLSGIMAARGSISFPVVMAVTVAAGLAGSLLLYFLGRKGGSVFLNAYTKRFPKHKEAVEKSLAWLKDKGFWGVFAAKLLPMVRTLISIPAGVLQMDLKKYVISSTMGIFVWNLFFVGAGYLLGDKVFELLA